MPKPAWALVFLLILSSGATDAQDSAKSEADACAGFDWPLVREAAWLSAPDLPVLASGSSLPADRPAALLSLKPSAEAGLPQAPSRETKPGSFAGYVRIAPPATQKQVQITVAGEGWIDLLEEGGSMLKPTAHSGRKGCASLRKSLRFTASAKPLVVMVSNVAADSIRIAATSAE